MDNHHPAMQAVERAAQDMATTLPRRDRVRLELEAELQGLLMAARLHGFSLAVCENGQPCVVDLGSVA